MTELFLIAHLAGQSIAIRSAEVESVVDIPTIVPVPGASRQIRGLAALRSRVVTVIDTRFALGLPTAHEAGTRAVITVLDGHHYAVLVDTLDDIAPFELLPLSPGLMLDDGWRLAARGIIERDGEAMLAISLAAIVPATAAIAA